MKRRPAQRGLALVSVLWGVSILALIAAAMLAATVTSAQIERNVWDAARGGAIADAAVAKGILSLLDSRAAPRADGTPAAIDFDGTAVQLRIQDEAGRINLNFADAALLKSLFVSAGVTAGDAGALADRIVARRAPPAGGGPSTAPFHAVEEVLAVPGMSRALFARAAPALTVYGRSGAVEQSVAPRDVLRALPGMDEQAIAQMLKARDQPRQPGDQPVARAAPGAVFTLTAQADAGRAHVTRVAVVEFTGDAAKPYLVLAWR